MKLFLSSYRIAEPEGFCAFVGKPAGDIRVGLVFNAKDYKPAQERADKLVEHLGYFRGLGFQVEEVDLLSYGDADELEKALSAYDVLWFNGGNVYYLRWAIEESGAKEIITRLCNGGMVYAGDSAGAVVAGPTIKGYEVADDPAAAPEYIGSGLGLFATAIIPHWGSVEYASVLDGIEADLKKRGYETLRLTDDEYVMVVDGVVVGGKG